jgi:outer membrane biosynthesis protein TonB
MQQYALISLGLHFLFILLVSLGVFQVTRKELVIRQPIPVEIVETEDRSTSPDPKPESLKFDTPVEKEEILPTPTPDPDPAEEQQPEQTIQPEPEPEVAPAPTPQPKIKPPAKKKPVKKKAPAPAKKAPPKKEKPQDVLGILKNLSQEQKAKGSSTAAAVTADHGTGGEKGDKMMASELDRVRKQLESTWKIPAGAQGVHKVSVPIKIWVNPDRTVREAKVVNEHLMRDVAYRTLAESALHAVLTFRDRPLLLPPEKYSVWKEITIHFDPSKVL